ncbi:MAG: helix-turn-helix transcriptional regulator [Solirubrobacteraceae bacterium]|nr:helix-turn-helix transcriptional regulator [Solirubrobacteraceae bacterium]
MSATRDDRAGLVFGALADSTRRLLVRRLASGGPATISALAEGLPISRQATTKHLGVLAQAGLIVITPDGRERHCAFAGGALDDAVGWILETGDGWDRRLDRLQRAAEATIPR